MIIENNSAVKITRSRDKVFGRLEVSSPSPSLQFSLQERPINGHQAKSKRAASDENIASATTSSDFQHKRRMVFKDVTNITRKSNYLGCLDVSKVQVGNFKTMEADENFSVRMAETQGISLMMDLDEKETQENTFHSVTACSDSAFLVSSGSEGRQLKDDAIVCHKLLSSNYTGILNADSNSEDSLACTLYAHDIYDTARIIELDHRPSTNYMDRLQKNITPIMRGILIDWLVEVSEEYKLVSDTLYLTVNLIDRFLSQSCIERQRLQLLGVTCMLIASKYEETCAPCAEDFCFITDNTYTRGEVLEMEGEVLNVLNFQLSVPTTKSFLRRFVQEAQASYKDSSVEFENLTDYLAELTLTQYSFLKFLPSSVAASVVLLARWLQNQQHHPWNATLEQYTKYCTADLKAPVLALEELRLNASACPPNSVFHKYKKQEFRNVANLTSQQSIQSVFQR